MTKHAIINAAKQILESLRFKNEHSFTLDKFSSNLRKACDELSDCGREVTNGHIVDSLWDRIKSKEITVNISALKVDYQRNPRDCKLILQGIVTETTTAQKVSYSEGARNVFLLTFLLLLVRVLSMNRFTLVVVKVYNGILSL